jgi:hypothetical protein
MSLQTNNLIIIPKAIYPAMNNKTFFAIFILLFLSLFSSHASRTTTISKEQVDSQRMNQNKINYITNKGGYFKGLATTNSALAYEAINRKVRRDESKGITRTDPDQTDSYNEQLEYKLNRTSEFRGAGYDESALLNADPDETVSSVYTTGTSVSNAARANLVAAETLYLIKEATFNEKVAPLTAATAAEAALYPSWDIALKLKEAMEAEFDARTELNDLNTARSEYSAAVDDQATKLTAKGTAISEYDTAVSTEATKLSAKETADTNVTNSQNAYNTAVQEHSDAVTAEASKLSAKNTATTAVNNSQNTYNSAVHSTIKFFEFF